MEIVEATLWAVIMVTVVTSKPVFLDVEEDSSQSSESNESMSSEETNGHLGQSQPTSTDIGIQMDHLDSTPDTAVPSAPEDPQTSTDIEPLQNIPGNPCQTAFHVDNSLGSEQDSPNAGVNLSTKKPQGTSGHEALQQDATPPTYVHLLTPTPLFSTDLPLTIPAEDTTTNTPDCFTIRLTTPEPAPPRGDSI